jgi:DNA-binding GntR family transcriptional regulator
MVLMIDRSTKGHSAISRSRRSVIADQIRQDIITGVLRPGAWVTLGDLSERFGVSITPIREAVLSLADEGIVTVQTRKGILIIGLSAQDFEDISDLYAIVSGKLVERAVQSATDEDIERLQQFVDAMETETDPDQFESMNWAFHRSINRLSDSRYLRYFAKTLVRNMSQKYFTLVPGRRDETQRAHAALVDALRKRDAVRAKALAEEHMRLAARSYVQHLSESGYWDSTDGSRTT